MLEKLTKTIQIKKTIWVIHFQKLFLVVSHKFENLFFLFCLAKTKTLQNKKYFVQKKYGKIAKWKQQKKTKKNFPFTQKYNDQYFFDLCVVFVFYEEMDQKKQKITDKIKKIFIKIWTMNHLIETTTRKNYFPFKIINSLKINNNQFNNFIFYCW